MALIFRCSVNDVRKMSSREFSLWSRFFRKFCPTGFNPFRREDFSIARMIFPHYHKVEFQNLIPDYNATDVVDPEEAYKKVYRQLIRNNANSRSKRKYISFNKDKKHGKINASRH